jgi:pyridoxal phosphate enzyme (YggS family)
MGLKQKMYPIGTINKNLQTVKRAIDVALRQNNRLENAAKLVAVSKTKPQDVIEQALKAGQRLFGENRVQETEQKWLGLKKLYPDAQLHLIGPLQTNKAALAVSMFDVIETIDRLKLAKAVSRHIKDTGRNVRCFVQVNTGKELQKAGVFPEAADEFIETCKFNLNLTVEGLMCIPPTDEEPALHFALLRKIAERNKIKELSMGMSADYETAIQFGATYVRIGTAIFGSRKD